MSKHKRISSTTSTQDTEATAPESSHRPHGRVDRFPENTWELVHHDETSYVLVEGGVKRLRISRSKDSLSRSTVPPNERASLTSDTQEAVNHMHSRSGPATNMISLVQDDLDAADSLQDMYLELLWMFDAVIGEIADVCRPSSRSEPN
ncbi:hypothetical protein BDR03DRAFT_221746 [Suillus americanus]|nr:hypothetical protein BDR03DRAFT_221746 [Suillus americanus]